MSVCSFRLIFGGFSKDEEGEEEEGESSPVDGGGDAMMLAVPNLAFSNINNNQDNDAQEVALLLTKLMTPLRQQYNITPLSFVSIQLEKVVCLFTFVAFDGFGCWLGLSSSSLSSSSLSK